MCFFIIIQQFQKRTPHYIRYPNDGTVLTICDDVLMFKSPSYVPDNTQLWYLDDQPDGSFMIVSKMNRNLVLACDFKNNENKIFIKERHGDESQKWSVQNNKIVSLKHQTIMCVQKQEHSLICVRNMAESKNEMCYLQPSVSFVQLYFLILTNAI